MTATATPNRANLDAVDAVQERIEGMSRMLADLFNHIALIHRASYHGEDDAMREGFWSIVEMTRRLRIEAITARWVEADEAEDLDPTSNTPAGFVCPNGFMEDLYHLGVRLRQAAAIPLALVKVESDADQEAS